MLDESDNQIEVNYDFIQLQNVELTVENFFLQSLWYQMISALFGMIITKFCAAMLGNMFNCSPRLSHVVVLCCMHL